MTDTMTGATRHGTTSAASGASADTGETYEKRDPWRPVEVTGVYQASGAADVDAAVAAARDALPCRGPRCPRPRAPRSSIGRRTRSTPARSRSPPDMTAEMGKPLREARMEAARAATILRFAAGEAWRPIGEVYAASVALQRLYTVRRPLGVVGLITPWNFPIAIPVMEARARADPRQHRRAEARATTRRGQVSTWPSASPRPGLPAGVLNVLTGSGSTVGAAARREPGRPRDLVHGLGRGRVTASATRATARGCRVQLELGGQNPLVVMADAELDRAVEAAYAGAFWSAGQKCTATRRILVQEPAYDAFREKLLARVARGPRRRPVRPRDGGRPARHRARARGRARRDRARPRRGRDRRRGRRARRRRRLPRRSRPSSRTSPTTRSSRARRCSARSRRSTASPRSTRRSSARTRCRSGSSASIFTRDLHAVQRFSEELQAGILHVNSQTAGADVHVPFGGIKGSGYGPHEQGRAALEFFTEAVTVYQDAPLALRLSERSSSPACSAASEPGSRGRRSPTGTRSWATTSGTTPRGCASCSATTADRVAVVRGDVTDVEALERVLDEHEITRVVHLAALQVPFVRANPPLGMRVNVAGTVNVFEAVSKRLDRIPGVAYASSAAVYGLSDPSPAPESGGTTPGTLYGVSKLADEGMARVYAADAGLPSIGLRPYVVYGPGRDQGMTSGPTMAMLAAARGEPLRHRVHGEGPVRLRAGRRARVRHGGVGSAGGRRRLQPPRRERLGRGGRRHDPSRRPRRRDHVGRRAAAVPARARVGRLRARGGAVPTHAARRRGRRDDRALPRRRVARPCGGIRRPRRRPRDGGALWRARRRLRRA